MTRSAHDTFFSGIKREYRLRNTPTVQQYMSGLEIIKPTEWEVKLLLSQYWAPAKTVTATQLASLVRIKGGYRVVNRIYGGCGHRFCKWLGTKPDVHGLEKNRWWSIWSIGFSTSTRFLWQMHPEVSEALERLGWVNSHNCIFPEETFTSSPILEGAVKHVMVNSYERNPQARNKCINYYGCICSICGIDFGERYGVAAAGYIHVHHLKEISKIGQEYQVDPIKDLRPVCPNCHGVIHLRNPPYTADEIKNMIRRNNHGER